MKDLKPMLLTNNQRKMYGLPLRRKKNRKKRIYTRCEADETITAFIDYPMRRKTPCFSYGDIRRVHRIYASN